MAPPPPRRQELDQRLGTISLVRTSIALARVEAMRSKIKAGGHASPYRLRKQLPELVFGQIKQARGFRQFLLRGIDKVRAECVCFAHNVLKLAQRRSLSAAMPMAAGTREGA